MKKGKKIVSATLAAVMVTSMAMGTTEAFARSSKRAAWNDASSNVTTGMEVKDACFVEDGSETESYTAYSNVYANSESWAAYQESWKTIRSNYQYAALTPGSNATQLNFAWYSTTASTPIVELMDANGNVINDFLGTQDAANAETVTEGDVTTTLIPCKVTVTGLTENTSYKYKYLMDEGVWSETFAYSTKSTESFSALYVGDPQIGASTGQLDGKSKEYFAMNDAYNWNQTMQNAISAHSNVSFLLSAGDQINQTSVSSEENKLEQQIEYAGFLSTSVLRSLPIATTIGNHDSKSVNYSNHFNYPNAVTSDGQTTAGSDYYFTYGNTLFISIDTNNYNCSEHEAAIKQATEANPDATWRILMFHQDIYGSGYDHSDTDGIALRTQLTPIIDNYDIDAVLQGHDHTYSRTYQITADALEHSSYTGAPSTGTDEFNNYLMDNVCYNLVTGAADTSTVVNPKGTVFFEANSSSGSKFYQLIGTQQDYIAARTQSWRPTYSVLDITATSITVKTYDAATNTELVADGGVATAYTIVKTAAVDKTELQTELKAAQDKLAEVQAAGTYADLSVKALSDTITAAAAINDSADATITDVASAVASLKAAVAGLQVKQTEQPTTEQTTTEQNTTTNGTTANNSVAGHSNNSGNSGLKGSDAPSTGDSALPMALWFVLGGCSLAGIVGVAFSEKKKRKDAK